MSKSFNQTERLIAGFLAKFPFIKSIVKRSYQIINYYLFKRRYTYKTNLSFFAVNQSGEAFGGYYDKSQVNPSNDLCFFYHAQQKTHHSPSASSPLLIKILNFPQQTLVKEMETKAFNWQQGAKCQWINNEEIIYNDYRNDQYVSVIFNAKKNQEIKIIDYPIYDCFNDQYAFSLNYERLAYLRPDYGYFASDEITSLPHLHEDGIYKIDLNSGTKKLFIPLSDAVQGTVDVPDASHLFNHIMISPDGKHFIFLHRYFLANGRRFDRLMVADAEKGQMDCLSDDGMVSHCTWKNNSEIVGWMHKKGLGNHYYCIDILTKKVSVVGEKQLKEDGHPSISNNEEWLLTDTYPDKSRMSSLLLFNLNTNECIHLGAFFSPLKFNGVNRCDLHPRFSYDNKSIMFDSVHEGQRKMYVMDVSDIIK